MTIVEGFDARYWDGVLSLAHQRRFKFAGIKTSQGTRWTPREGWGVLQRQWNRANSRYGLLRLPFHYLTMPYPWTEPVQYGKDQAKNMFNTIRDVFGNDYGELPPAIDVEQRYAGMAGGDNRVATLKACLEKTTRLWNKVPLIYTATWYWDKYIHPYVGSWQYWKEYDLWEADPPPDTAIKGWVDGGVVTQVLLDTTLPGFNSGIDLNETTQEWIDSVTKPTAPPPPECEMEKITAYNQALDDVITAAQGLRK